MTFTKYTKYFSLLLSLIISVSSYGANDTDNQDRARRALIGRLKNLTLEQLIEVETFNPKGNLAARKFQQLTETAAALFVITQEDIRRAGMTRLAEVLRMVPGLQVARISPHQWALSARGLNEYYASKLLVMIDGRTVYTPLRAEVFWDVQDLLIEDVERIEVIRGPGASLWGANAVNGIINIITKAAKDTPGNLVTTQVGSGEEQAVVGMQHGGALLNDAGHYRVYGKFYQHDDFPTAQGVAQNNTWQQRRGGGRLDWDASNRDALTLQGDVYDGVAKQPTVIPIPPVPPLVEAQTEVRGFNFLSRWQRNLDNGDVVLQSYYDRTYRKELFSEEHREIFDLDFQHRWQVGEQHEFMWGLGYRYTQDQIDGFYIISYQPPRRHDQLFSAFVQSEWLLQPALRLTIGSKFEHNNYTSFEFQPTTRLLWHFAERQSVWAAVSRAVRTPSRTDEDMVLNLTVPNFQMVIQGNADLKSESLRAYELGYRFNLPNYFLLDASLFYNKYDDLRTTEPVAFKPFPPPPTLFTRLENQMFGELYGLELAAHWQASPTWKLVGTYNYLGTFLHTQPSSRDMTTATQLEQNSPHHQASLRSLLNLPQQVEFDTAWYYVDNVPNQHAAHYTRFDVRFGWRPWPALELSLGGRNLLDKQHREFGNGENGTVPTEVPRAFYLQLKYRF